MRLWYKKPAYKWEEALPIGNGRMGAMVFGRPDAERIQFNEDSIWSGGPTDRINPDALAHLDEIRDLIRQGRIPEAEHLSALALAGTPNSQRSFQPAGDLLINFLGASEPANYMRELDLETGIVKLCYKNGDSIYHREAFASYPDGVVVYRMCALGGDLLNLDVKLQRGYNDSDSVRTENGNSINLMACGGKGISFSFRVMAIPEGGTIQSIGEHLVIRDAKAVTFLTSIATSFRFEDYEQETKDRIEDACRFSFDELKARHIEDYTSLYKRLQVSLGDEAANEELDKTPTDERLEAVRSGAEDTGLIALHFQYGRYLLISSSRPGSLPANLQGVWNEAMGPAWGSKYTININLEMNYWIAESGNLPECHLPFFDLLKRVMVSGRETARRMYNCRGSVAHHNTDIYADTAPQDTCISATFWIMGEAWLATHIWEHYLYTGDKEFLAHNFEVLEECLLFFEDFLTMNSKGELVTIPTISPENTYILPDGTRGCMCEGCAMDTEILTELLHGYIHACRVLGKESADISRAQKILNGLPELKVGSHGQIQEWNEDYEEAEPGHRHISQLYALYPGTFFSWQDTPDMMEAARKTLERRLSFGGGHTGWSRAWIIGLWARLYEGDKAAENYRALLSGSTFPNLMDNHPLGPGHIFQIDGNFGASAALIEMLAQSHGDRIVLLPAPSAHLSEGSISGVRLRPGITLSMTWKDQKVVSAVLTADRDMDIRVVIGGEEKTISLLKNKEFSVA